MGFAYNVGKSVGAGSVVGVGVLSTHIGLANAMGAFCPVAYAIAVFGILLLPETRGIAIEAIGAAEDEPAAVASPTPRGRILEHLKETAGTATLCDATQRCRCRPTDSTLRRHDDPHAVPAGEA